MYSTQYSSKRMQCNACSKQNLLYQLMQQFAVLLFCQPQNTANWDVQAPTYLMNVTHTFQVHLLLHYTNHGGCIAVCKPKHHLLHKSYSNDEVLGMISVSPSTIIVLFSQQTEQAKERKRQLKPCPEMQHLSVGSTRVQHPCIKSNIYLLTLSEHATQLHLAVLSTMDSSMINDPPPIYLTWTMQTIS